MKVKKLILENFRAYKERTTIPFSGLTGFIGRNDTGKSSILEAMDIFSEGDTVKIEQKDANIKGDPKNVRIGMVFEGLPEQLVLDTKAPTTLKDEFLLNEDGDLEIHKVFDCGKLTPSAEIFARAVHPTVEKAKDILQKSQKDLKETVKDLGLSEECDQTKNPSMRSAIYNSIDNLGLSAQNVPLNEENGKKIWEALKSYFPLFALFQSDRPSKDQDPEAQNPMKVAIKQALSSMDAQLTEIINDVHRKAEETANRTLKKLNEMHPGIASDLKPSFKKPSWSNIFKLDLVTDDAIPLNKRGSGVRRLVLLSFFQAEAERLRNLKSSESGIRSNVIYAIEEPEASQHPDIQQQIIDALRALANAGEQVVLTTHVPALAALMPLDSLRFVSRDSSNRDVKVLSGFSDDEVYKQIADTLGVLPDPLAQPGVKVSILVEGKNDVDALHSIINILVDKKDIEEWEKGIFWTMGGGIGTLGDWVKRQYLDKLRIPQVIIIDSDKVDANTPLANQKQKLLDSVKERGDVKAFVTNKRCMDNYIHPKALERWLKNKSRWPSNVDIDYADVSKELCVLAENSKQNIVQSTEENVSGLFDNTSSYGNRIKNKYKGIIATEIMGQMSNDELLERSKYHDNGEDKCEVTEWIDAIKKHIK